MNRGILAQKGVGVQGLLKRPFFKEEFINCQGKIRLSVIVQEIVQKPNRHCDIVCGIM